MPDRLPALKPREVLRALQRAGYYIDHHAGGHVILYKDDQSPPLSVPLHNKDIRIGTLRSIIKLAGLTPEQFKRLR